MQYNSEPKKWNIFVKKIHRWCQKKEKKEKRARTDKLFSVEIWPRAEIIEVASWSLKMNPFHIFHRSNILSSSSGGGSDDLNDVNLSFSFLRRWPLRRLAESRRPKNNSSVWPLKRQTHLSRVFKECWTNFEGKIWKLKLSDNFV